MRAKAPLADQGWCSAQRIRILMIAGGNHTIIHAVMAVSRKAMTEGIRTFLFPGTPCERNLTIPQSKIEDFCQLPLHKGAVGCSRTSAFFDVSQKTRKTVPHSLFDSFKARCFSHRALPIYFSPCTGARRSDSRPVGGRFARPPGTESPRNAPHSPEACPAAPWRIPPWDWWRR